MILGINVDHSKIVDKFLENVPGVTTKSIMINKILDNLNCPKDRILFPNLFDYTRMMIYIRRYGTVVSGVNSYEACSLDIGFRSYDLISNQLIKLDDGVYFIYAEWEWYDGRNQVPTIVLLPHIDPYKFIIDFSKKLMDMNMGNKDDLALSKLFLPESLLSDIKEDIQSFMDSRSVYKDDLGLPWKRGYMLIGPPGNGKTLLIRSIAKMYGLRTVDISKTVDKYGNLDMTANAVTVEDELCFDSFRPVMYIMEDIDKLTTFRSGSGDESDAGTISLHQILKGLDGVEEVDGAIIMATTNYPDQLPESLINRPGRFDRIWKINKPEQAEMIKFLQYHKISVLDHDLNYITSRLKGYSMVFVEELIKSLKKKYHKNQFSVDEVDDILNRIHAHNDSHKKHFKEDRTMGF